MKRVPGKGEHNAVANILASAIIGVLTAGMVLLWGGPDWAAVGFGFLSYLGVVPWSSRDSKP